MPEHPDWTKENCPFSEKIEEIHTNIKDVKKILYGNGEIGLSAQVKLNTSHIDAEKKKRDGLYTWVFRVIIGFVLGYIAYKVGLVK